MQKQKCPKCQFGTTQVNGISFKCLYCGYQTSNNYGSSRTV